MTTEAITPLRQRMIEDMTSRKLCAHTQRGHISYKAEKFDNCTMSRTVGDLGISFVQTQDGLLLLLESPKWKLERGKAYSVRLIAGSQSVDAKALAETKGVTIALADRPFNGELRSANALDVRGEGTTLRVPLDKSATAFDRLEICFEKMVTAVRRPIRLFHLIGGLSTRLINPKRVAAKTNRKIRFVPISPPKLTICARPID
jgi:hypothetical protein